MKGPDRFLLRWVGSGTEWSFQRCSFSSIPCRLSTIRSIFSSTVINCEGSQCNRIICEVLCPDSWLRCPLVSLGTLCFPRIHGRRLSQSQPGTSSTFWPGKSYWWRDGLLLTKTPRRLLSLSAFPQDHANLTHFLTRIRIITGNAGPVPTGVRNIHVLFII